MKIFNYYDEEKGDFKLGKIIGHIILAILILCVLFGSMGNISAGEMGVKTRFGAVVGTVQQGLYFKMPIVEQVHKMSIKTLTINYDKAGDSGENKVATDNLFGASKDLQDVSIGVVVNYHVDATKVQEIYSQYSSVENYQSNVVEPMIREIVKSTSAQYTAEELVTKRAEFSDKVNVALATQFTAKSAVLERFSVTNFQFSTTYSKAIELKVTAEQNALTEKNNLAIEEYKAQQRVAQAKGEAEAIKIQAQAVNSQGGADYVALQAIKQWDGHYPTTVMGGSTVPLIQLK
jgi:regulator of protease activity HflC (stomatin/prohibitin superfamily)